jgi:isopenicillin-N epimerase
MSQEIAAEIPSNLSSEFHVSDLRAHWPLDPEIAFLNHGSFGACTTRVLAYQSELRERLEREPVAFFTRFLPDALDKARQAVAAWLHADPEGFAFVPNASAGVATVLSNLRFEPGDEILVTNQTYQACLNMIDHLAARTGARLVMVEIPWPGTDPESLVTSLAHAITPRTKLAFLDHITSPMGLVLPLEDILPHFARHGVPVLIDGAHAPGHIPLDVTRLFELGATFYTGNGHKWPCAPKGAAFLAVRGDYRDGFHPLVISHGYSQPLKAGQTRFRAEFDWTGTSDPTPYLAWPAAIAAVGALMDGGFPTIMAENRRRAIAFRARLCERLDIPEPTPASMVGGLAAVPLPRPMPDLHDHLFNHSKIEIPVIPWPPHTTHRGDRPHGAVWVLRAAIHLHTRASDLDRLMAALDEVLP